MGHAIQAIALLFVCGMVAMATGVWAKEPGGFLLGALAAGIALVAMVGISLLELAQAIAARIA